METTTGLEAWEQTQSWSWLPEFNPATASRADEQRELMRRLLQRGVTVRTLADAVALSRDALRAHFRKDNIQVPRWPGVAERPRGLTDAPAAARNSAVPCSDCWTAGSAPARSAARSSPARAKCRHTWTATACGCRGGA